MLTSRLADGADLVAHSSQFVVAMVSPDQGTRLREAVPAGVRLIFVRSDDDASALRETIASAKALVIDPANCRPRGPGVKLVELSALAGVPTIVLMSLKDSTLGDGFAALRTAPVDILFESIDTVQRHSSALAGCTDRRWPMLLAAKLEAELERLPYTVGLFVFGMICGGIRPESVSHMSRLMELSTSTAARDFAYAGLCLPHSVLAGARVVWALDSLRMPGRLPDIAKAFGFGTGRSLTSSLRALAKTDLEEIREGLAPTTVVERVAASIRVPLASEQD